LKQLDDPNSLKAVTVLAEAVYEECLANLLRHCYLAPDDWPATWPSSLLHPDALTIIPIVGYN
jgi:hypothetical protein